MKANEQQQRLRCVAFCVQVQSSPSPGIRSAMSPHCPGTAPTNGWVGHVAEQYLGP